jgi:hypothetical protein
MSVFFLFARIFAREFRVVGSMTLEERELLNTLCQEIQAEKDPARFAILLEELNRFLATKDKQIGKFPVDCTN